MIDLTHARYRYQTPSTPESDTLYWYPVLHDGRITRNINPNDPRLRYRWFGAALPGCLAPDHDDIRRAVEARLASEDITGGYDFQTPLRQCCANLCDPAKVQALADRTICQAPEPAPDLAASEPPLRGELTLEQVEGLRRAMDTADLMSEELIELVRALEALGVTVR